MTPLLSRSAVADQMPMVRKKEGVTIIIVFKNNIIQPCVPKRKNAAIKTDKYWYSRKKKDNKNGYI